MTQQVALHAYLSDSCNSLPNRQFVHDVAKAALKAGGIVEGTKIELNVFNQPPYTDIAQALQASFAHQMPIAI
ncbi:hypothetical protein SAMN05444064_107110 [Pseudomonas syringae]|uniref:peptide ABC transporter substrate-binding protein n=1 Tax=Pseudomonas syringae TaxID=317 RepID=UPI00089ABC7C|nr:peptide ABC transporter substrate-binding protein [Pseudomonas syringae]SDW81778.1 hypothetical protein SAMN05444514_107129 [Pseudomonas syringae]SFL99587.1 hypothetical protein SAMN05444064_107110 [Pseudomonas syringae]